MSSQEARVATLERFIAANRKAEERRDWTVLGEFYSPEALYEYDTGSTRTVARGPDEICRLVMLRDQLGWLNWSFPFEAFAVQGDHAFTHWWNRGPGRRPDGGYWQVIGMSHITFADDDRFAAQIDLFDMGRLVQLMDEMPPELLLPVMRDKQLPWMRRAVAQSIAAKVG